MMLPFSQAAARHLPLGLALALLMLSGLAPAQSFTDSIQFPEGASRADVDLVGTAKTAEDYVQLTDDLTYEQGTLIIKSLPAADFINRLSVKFEVQINGGSIPPADGFSFNFGPELFGSTIGEDGIAKGLAVTFDVYDSQGSDTAPAVEVVYDSIIKAGISFSGQRFENRASGYSLLARNPDGSTASLMTGANFVPVQVDLSIPKENGGGVVTVTWNGVKILENIAVPFSPAQGWHLGLGARTGAKTMAQRVRNISIEADALVHVSVNSAYGEHLLSPAPGSKPYTKGQSVTFSAPDFVYLDRYRKTLSGTDNENQRLAAYRARRVGGTRNGEPLQPGATVKLEQDTIVNWQWELEFLAEVNTGTESIQGLSASAVTDSPNQPTLGRNFRASGYNFSSVVYSQIMGVGIGLDVQFQPRGYVIENAPESPERFLQLSGTGDHLRTSAAGTDLIGNDGSFTMEFWARRDPVTMTADQNVVALGTEVTPAGQLRAGFTAGNAFFLTNNGTTVAAASALTDSSWHHWAAVNDKSANTVTLYRDGKVVATGNQALNLSVNTQAACVGARANWNKAEGFFPGGINNVRVWKTALSIEQIRSARSTVLVGTGNASLALELPFDTLPTDRSGVYMEQRVGTPLPASVADTESFPVKQLIVGNTFFLPGVNPAASPAGYYGWTMRSRLYVSTAGNYTFRFDPGDGGQLLIDGIRMLNTDGQNDEALDVNASRFLSEGYHSVEVHVVDRGNGALSLMYESAEASVALQRLPSSNLRMRARDFLALGGLTLASSEGNNFEFKQVGFDAVISASATGAEMVASVLPGFHFNPLDTTSGSTHNIDPNEQGALTDYRRVFWLWDKKFRFKAMVNAVGLPDAAVSATSNLPYFKTVDGVQDGRTAVKTQAAAGMVSVLDLWLAEGEKLEVGTIYRTDDRRYTLKSVSAAMNNFSGINFRSLLNATFGGQPSKAVTIPAVSAPGSMNLDYSPTTYRAQLAIGEGLDFTSAAAIDLQLTPDLPDDAVLVSVTADSQPTVTGPDVTQNQPGWTSGEGDPWQWDVLGKKWYPLKPGTYTLAWKDKNTGETYNMEVTADFPHVTKSLAFLEDAQGNYLGTAPAYQTDYQFAAAATAFPAAPGAHYRYLVSPNQVSPFPVDLDPAPTDRWNFLRQAFSEQDTAKVDEIGAVPRFTETTADRRTVLVFSYRPSTGAASGDLGREKIAVRVVTSLDPETHQDDGPAQVVASRISSQADTARYGSGYVVNEISNYNATLYDRSAAVGKWGPVFPVNWAGLFEENQRLSIGYYENPGADPVSLDHPPVGWPYVMTHYDHVDFPAEDAPSAIYIASQLGSEGVAKDGEIQPVYDPTEVGNLTVYQQPDRTLPGFNPNEEHALVAPSHTAVMTGDPSANLGQSAFFALQQDINRTDRVLREEYTSEPFVLGQYTNLATGQSEMVIYQVLTTRAGTADFPALDEKTHRPVDESGAPVPQPADPTYHFETVAFAGDVVAPFYPLNLVGGGSLLPQSRGGNIVFKDRHDADYQQRTLWQDKTGVPWVVAGDIEGEAELRIPGRFFYRFWYPLAPGFWLGEGEEAAGGASPVAWLPQHEEGTELALADFQNGTQYLSQEIRYRAYWKDGYPVLKRGETLTYPGGEYKADNPAAPGLPGVIGWASAEIVFDNATPAMDIDKAQVNAFNGRFMRLLDAYTTDYAKEALPTDLKVTNAAKVSAEGSRWYYKELTGSLSRRFYYDVLQSKLVLRGRLNNLESGDPKLTQTPVGLAVMEPNVIDERDVKALENLAPGNSEWKEAIEKLFQQSNPAAYAREVAPVGDAPAPHVPGGLEAAPSSDNKIQFYLASGTGDSFTQAESTTEFSPLKSLGVGAALVPNPESLLEPTGEDNYLTVVENNDAKVNGAVTLHVIRLGDERFRGAIAVITPQNAFDDKVQLLHSADFGGQSEEIYYQWWVHEVAPLDSVITPDQSTAGWQIYQQGKGLRGISFSGRPDMTLADKLFFVRAGHESELATADSAEHVENDGVLDAAWRLVSPDDTSPAWGTSPADRRVPYQWAGAANSPQLLASGAHRFLPQLLMGWVKRVLDAVNPYEARFSANFNGDSPATYSSMLVEAGRPYNGPVALNASKDAIENVGLIELYETVLQRAKDLTADYADDGTNQALLLASTRLAMFYELLAGEAYTDAQNSSIALSTADASNTAINFSELSAANPYTFAFQNVVPNLLQEELALLRGTDFLKSYPVQNRLFWNYFKGLGEAAYNANYNISDATRDGLIDENDGAALYPMGHGDAWGHFLSAIKMHHGLLRRENYDWKARAELYSLLGNVIPTDYLDEQSFARTAAAKARSGLSIVKATYRDAYVADPTAPQQGYTDAADPTRAWGVSEWATRSGQGAHFDWLVGNAILPATATSVSGQAAQGLDNIDRETGKADLQALAGSLQEIQQTLVGVNQGATPIGLDPEAINFGLDSFLDGASWERRTHFEQTYDRAVAAATNARTALDFVSSSQQNLRQIADDTSALKEQVIKQDIDYRNRLIALLGTPYNGAIGAGQIFQEGYTGPDLLTYMYLDATTVEQVLPTAADKPEAAAFRDARISIQESLVDTGSKLEFLPIGMPNLNGKEDLKELFEKFHLSADTQGEYPKVIINGFSEHTHGVTDDNKLSVEIPISLTSQYAFTAPEGWGRRDSPGEIQIALGDMLRTEIALETALDDYQVYINKLANLAAFADRRLVSLNGAQISRQSYLGLISGANATKTLLESLVKETEYVVEITDTIFETSHAAIPKNINIVGGQVPFVPIDAASEAVYGTVTLPVEGFKSGTEIAAIVTEGLKVQLELLKENDADVYSEFNELLELLKELSNELQEEPVKRLNMADAINNLSMAGNRVRALESEANRLVAERAAMNKMIASRAQRNRYSDMVTRLSRDETAYKYESAMDNAVRYAWLAAKAYDYETSLSPGHPANAATVLEELMRVRQLGRWDDGAPRIGNGGLAEVLAKLMANYTSLKGQIGVNNPQWETDNLSLRTERQRILPKGTSSASDEKWRSYLASTQVTDLNQDQDFTRFCRPFSAPGAIAQPGFKIEFSTEINSGRNFFGKALSAADHAYSSANFATKIRSVGIVLDGYDVSADGKQKLAATPRVYLVPAGTDILRYSDGSVPKTRGWNVVNQRIPVPFAINTSSLNDLSFSPSLDGLNGRFGELVRFGDFRAYPTAGGVSISPYDTNTDSQLFSRSVWNTRWVLFIPAASLGSDQNATMQRFIDTVTDVQLKLVTFSSSGM